MPRRELLLGCGHRREKAITVPELGVMPEWHELVTVDVNAACKPDYVTDLNYPCEAWDPGPWYVRDSYDEIHAYEILEHIRPPGLQSFFELFKDLWRLLKPGGVLCATCPAPYSEWAWGDPGHVRVISKGSLIFLSMAAYEAQLGKTAMSDYRYLLRPADFRIVHSEYIKAPNGDTHAFCLQAIKDGAK